MAKVKYYSILRLHTKRTEEIIDKPKISSVLKSIEQQYGSEVYKLCKKSVILVNGENAGHMNGHATKLRETDVVKIIPVTGGG